MELLWFMNDISTGWWLTNPSEKYELVNWDDEIPDIWKNKIHVPVTTNQLFIIPSSICAEWDSNRL